MTPTLLIRSAMLLVPEASPLRTQNVEMRRSRTHGRPCWFFSQHIQAQGTDCYEHVGWKPHQQTLTPRLKPKTLRCVVPHLSLSEKGRILRRFPSTATHATVHSMLSQARCKALSSFPRKVILRTRMTLCLFLKGNRQFSLNFQKTVSKKTDIFSIFLHKSIAHDLPMICP